MNDVRGAMERYRAHVAGVNAMIHPRELPYTYIDETTGAGGMVQEAWERDAHRLALAYLTEHAADDDEPVTEEWLWSVGFSPEPTEDEDYLRIEFTDCTGRVASAFVEFESRIWLGIEQLDYPRDRHSRIASLTTRGSVRRLAAALGIQLKGEQ